MSRSRKKSLLSLINCVLSLRSCWVIRKIDGKRFVCIPSILAIVRHLETRPLGARCPTAVLTPERLRRAFSPGVVRCNIN